MNRFAAAVVACTLLTTACATSAAEPTSTTPAMEPAPETRSIRILTIGDSLTRGESVATTDSWPNQLAAALADHGFEAAVDIVAGTGWTARRAAAEMDRIDTSPEYDLVFIQVGVNDHFYQFGVDNYLVGLEELGEDAVELTNAPGDVSVLSIVDWRLTPSGSDLAALYGSPGVTDHNAALASFAAESGFAFIDVTTPSFAMSGEPSLVAADGLHASAALYARWVERTILPAALARLGG
jgi:lysophospholipase L1-like esterase